MAKSTCNPASELPKGILRFEVIRTTIRDSLGQYCVPGDMAALDKRTADRYLKMNLIRVALPEFEGEDDDDDNDGADDGDGADKGERAKAAADTGGGAAQGRRGRSTIG